MFHPYRVHWLLLQLSGCLFWFPRMGVDQLGVDQMGRHLYISLFSPLSWGNSPTHVMFWKRTHAPQDSSQYQLQSQAGHCDPALLAQLVKRVGKHCVWVYSAIVIFYLPPCPTLNAPSLPPLIIYILDSHLTVPPQSLLSLSNLLSSHSPLTVNLRLPPPPISTSTKSRSSRLTLFSCCSVKWSVGEVHAEWRQCCTLVSGELEWRISRRVCHASLIVQVIVESGVTSDQEV